MAGNFKLGGKLILNFGRLGKTRIVVGFEPNTLGCGTMLYTTRLRPPQTIRAFILVLKVKIGKFDRENLKKKSCHTSSELKIQPENLERRWLHTQPIFCF
uniref:Uncharacterized protein n=1 Tax=Cacopsylla melanoneura TaxID=428564 RepID=A0A8D8QNX8_9HEMI